MQYSNITFYLNKNVVKFALIKGASYQILILKNP